MATPTVIKQLLQSLDHNDDKLWTDDGAPLVGVIQKLANYRNITRDQINAAFPGFARHNASPEAKVEVTEAKSAEAPGAPEVDMTTTDTDPVVDAVEDADAGAKAAAGELSKDQIRAILNGRVERAEQALAEARKAVGEAQAHAIACENRLRKAVADRWRQFPPISEAENIKAHLAAQGRLAMERAGLIGLDGNPTGERIPEPMYRPRPNPRPGVTQRPTLPVSLHGTAVPASPTKAA